MTVPLQRAPVLVPGTIDLCLQLHVWHFLLLLLPHQHGFLQTRDCYTLIFTGE